MQQRMINYPGRVLHEVDEADKWTNYGLSGCYQKRTPYDPFRTPVRSQLSCGLPDNAMNTLQPTAFYKLAENYLAGGRPLQTLCNHNANLATLLGQSNIAQSWRLVAALLEQTGLQKVYDHDAECTAANYREKYD
ncbi:unnamed protein product, partial [Cylicostephanus goldi]